VVTRKPRVRPLWSGTVAAIVLVLTMVVVMVSGVPGGPSIALPWSHQVTIHVQFTNADALAPHAGVDIAGVKVGEVHDVTSQGNIAVATLILDKSYSDIHSDAQVLLRPHGLFGPKYIEITPGTSTAPVVGDGGTISAANSVQPVDLDQLLQALQAPEAQNLRTAIVELGKAAAGKGDDVNHLLSASKTLTQTLQTPLQTLDNVSTNLSDFLVKDEAFNASFAQTPLDQLVASSNTTLAAFAANSTQLGSLLDHADSTLTQLDSAFGGEQSKIRQTIETLPATITKLNSFNGLIGLFAANLTGKEAGFQYKDGKPDVTQGIIDAIENIKSAFSSYDCSVSTSPCPEQDREYYLRVQTFNLGGSDQTTQQLEGILCTLPIPQLPGVHVPCPTATSSSGRSNVKLSSGDYSLLSSLIGS
jgi:phospholipid/cholesterol/gamma-HCH transport system substrate-binding protein